MITREFNLYLHAGHSIPLVINANQYDRGEQWLFKLFNSDGTQYTPSSGAIVGIKSDNLGIINTGSVDAQGRVVINETQQMTAAVGKAVFELLIDDQTHGTANFVVLVEPKPGDNADLSESDLSLIQQAIDGTSETAIAQGVSDWMDENLTPTTPVVDTSLTVSGAAADSAKVGQEISDLKSEIAQGSGLTTDIKQALMALVNHVTFDEDDPTGQTYIDDLYDALYPPIVVTAVNLSASTLPFGTLNATQKLTATTTPSGGAITWSSSNENVATVSQTGVVTSVGYGSATITATSGSVSATCSVTVTQATLVSISAQYTQSDTVYDTDSLDSLKDDLVVTANWSDSSTSTVASADYLLSGILVAGTSTITVTYSGETTTFTVTVTHDVGRSDMNGWTDGVPYSDLDIVQNAYVVANDGTFTAYNGWDRTGYVPCDGVVNLIVPQFKNDSDQAKHSWFYDDTKTPISRMATSVSDMKVIAVPSNAHYFVLSSDRAVLASVLNGNVIPDGETTQKWEDGVAYDTSRFSPSLAGYYLKKDTGASTTYAGWTALGFVDCRGASQLTLSSNPSIDLNYCCFYKDGGTFVGTFNSNKVSSTVINVPSAAKYFRLSAENAKIAQILDGTVTVTPSA